MVVISTVEDLRDYALKLAAEAQAKTPEDEPESIKKIKAILAKYSFNGHREPLTKLVSILVDTELKLPDTELKLPDPEKTYPQYTVVVPLEEANAHCYPVGRPFYVSKLNSERRAVDSILEDGSTGNNHHGAWRYATEDEVNAFFALASANSNLRRALSKIVSTF